MNELLELALKKIDILEKRLEKYYSLLKIDNELDFILNGTYILQSDFDEVMAGQYWIILKQFSPLGENKKFRELLSLFFTSFYLFFKSQSDP